MYIFVSTIWKIDIIKMWKRGVVMLIKDKLTNLRESKGMSKEDLATKLGIDLGKLESYESGEA